ncbi:MAG: ABC transporter permease [bacterium]|nr:MAG: ABC transporter permease [bacterium]
MTDRNRRTLIPLAALAGLFVLLTAWMDPWRMVLSTVFPTLDKVVYPLAPFRRLVAEHILLVGSSSILASTAGLCIGIAVTRQWGREFLPAVNALASMGQTFPPVAVLALAVPAVGFGFKPTVIALFLYGLLPVLRNTIAGLQTLDPAVLEAASGMGMNPLQILTLVEIPLALPVIMAGVRISTVINIGTATLGATIGAGGLGKPIIAGLIGENPAYIIEGAVLVGLFAILVDGVLGIVSRDRADG